MTLGILEVLARERLCRCRESCLYKTTSLTKVRTLIIPVKAAFTLLEILFALAILALLIAIAIPATSRATLYAARTKSISNLRQIGVASRLYANEHDQKLPGQISSDPLLPPPIGDGNKDRWPKLLCAYLSPSDPRVLLDPTDRAATQLTASDILSNDVNRTGYIYNGFDDLGRDGQPPAEVSLTMIDQPVNTILMSQKMQGAKDFYVDLLGAPLAVLSSLLNPAAFNGGSHYLYVDGSVRYLKEAEYSNQLWLVNKGNVLPPPFNNSRSRLAQDGTARGAFHTLPGL